MAGDDKTNKPDLRATTDPVPEQDAAQADAPQADAPLPAFIYGRDGEGDGTGRDRSRSGDRQNFNARIAEMDRKTLLGLVTGAGMLGLVLFFAGMLVGAGLFMDSDDTDIVEKPVKAPVEMLATAPEEPAAPSPVETGPETAPEIAADSADPVGDLIARRSAELAERDADTPADDASQAVDGDEGTVDAPVEAGADATDATEPAGTPAAAEAGEADAPEADKMTAPEIRDVAAVPAAPAAPAAPVIDGDAPATKAPAAQAAKTPPAAKEEAKAEPAPAPKAKPAATASNADTPFSVQVGAFKVHENASQRAEELRKKGLQVAVVVRGAEGEAAWYYVRVGKFATMKEARENADKIKKDHKLDGFPVRAEPNDREVD